MSECGFRFEVMMIISLYLGIPPEAAVLAEFGYLENVSTLDDGTLFPKGCLKIRMLILRAEYPLNILTIQFLVLKTQFIFSLCVCVLVRPLLYYCYVCRYFKSHL